MLKGAYSREPAFGAAEVRVYLPRDYQMRTTILGTALASSRRASTLRLCSARAEHLSAEGRRDALGGLIGLGGRGLEGWGGPRMCRAPSPAGAVCQVRSQLNVSGRGLTVRTEYTEAARRTRFFMAVGLWSGRRLFGKSTTRPLARLLPRCCCSRAFLKVSALPFPLGDT